MSTNIAVVRVHDYSIKYPKKPQRNEKCKVEQYRYVGICDILQAYIIRMLGTNSV